jgi:hypothetical protein
MVRTIAIAIMLGALGAAPAVAAEKNWTAPQAKIYAQSLSDETMRMHPDDLPSRVRRRNFPVCASRCVRYWAVD